MWLARQTVLGLTSLLLLAILGVSGALLWAGPGGLIGGGASLSLSVTSWFVERGRYWSWGYLERDEDLVVRRGLLFRRLTVIPFGRMQFAVAFTDLALGQRKGAVSLVAEKLRGDGLEHAAPGPHGDGARQAAQAQIGRAHV